MADTEPVEVPCQVCRRPCRSPVSRARRVGAGCWRKLRRRARQSAVPVALPGLSGRGGPGQAGPDLLDDVDELPDQDGPR